jgi:hypothetical protein
MFRSVEQICCVLIDYHDGAGIGSNDGFRNDSDSESRPNRYFNLCYFTLQLATLPLLRYQNTVEIASQQQILLSPSLTEKVERRWGYRQLFEFKAK